MTQTRRMVALALADEILTDIELSRLPAPEVVKKTSRLARLIDDTDAISWLSQEMTGFSRGKDGTLTPLARKAIQRSNRISKINPETGKATFWIGTLDAIYSMADMGRIQLRTGQASSESERDNLKVKITKNQEVISKIIGSIHAYVAEREIELRFGAAVEDAFMIVRNDVDARIAQLAPSAAIKFSAAFENASSGNPEHWANAASACRRLLKSIADELRPPGDAVEGRPMADDKYINRLIDWISNQHTLGSTHKKVINADLEDFGKRIDAFDVAGHKGAHAEVTQYEASRFIAGTYLLIGDILHLWKEVKDSSSIASSESIDDSIEQISTKEVQDKIISDPETLEAPLSDESTNGR